MSLIEGRDGSELFESHHLFTKKDVRDIMSGYEVSREDSIKSSGVYDWEATKTDAFTLELNERARKLLGNNLKATPWRIFEISVIFIIAMT